MQSKRKKISPLNIHTITGREISVEHVDAADINLIDIASGLSKVCRYSGQRPKFISVAEHSVYVSRHVPKRLAMHALFHDAAEAYMGDVPSPIKKLCQDFKDLEHTFDTAISEAFDLRKLTDKESALIKKVDRESCKIEQEGRLEYLEPTQAILQFLIRYEELKNEENRRHKARQRKARRKSNPIRVYTRPSGSAFARSKKV